LVEFYLPFLQELWIKAKLSGKQLAILAQAHLGHTPGIHGLTATNPNLSLDAQTSSAVEALDAMHAHFGPSSRIVLVGHSVGSWITLQVGQPLYESFRCTNHGLVGPEVSRRRSGRSFPPVPYYYAY
jgi:pimeloyl-ACP methyl ester carboxylesterase